MLKRVLPYRMELKSRWRAAGLFVRFSVKKNKFARPWRRQGNGRYLSKQAYMGLSPLPPRARVNFPKGKGDVQTPSRGWIGSTPCDWPIDNQRPGSPREWTGAEYRSLEQIDTPVPPSHGDACIDVVPRNHMPYRFSRLICFAHPTCFTCPPTPEARAS